MPSNIGLGYRIAQTDSAAKIAFELATELVRQATTLGTDLRSWGVETREKTHQILKMNIKAENALTDQKKVQEAITEVLKWEDEISSSIRNYFIHISDLLNKLKKLNPPLKTEQLDPYVEAILSDRRATMAALEPLSTVIQKITELKTQVWFESATALQ